MFVRMAVQNYKRGWTLQCNAQERTRAELLGGLMPRTPAADKFYNERVPLSGCLWQRPLSAPAGKKGKKGAAKVVLRQVVPPDW